MASRTDLEVGQHAELDEEDWDFPNEDTQYLLHNLHPYPARFIPQIPRRCIQRWTVPGSRVLDPFCGSGTTLLEAKLAGRDSIGVDNNGVATLIASAKIANYDEEDLAALSVAARQVKGLRQMVKSAPTRRIRYPSLEKWFDARAALDLEHLRSVVAPLPPRAKTLGMAIFSSIIVRASRQDSDTRYAAVKRHYEPNWALNAWAQRAEQGVERAIRTVAASRPSAHHVLQGDARSLPDIGDTTVDLVVTSPPYLNAYDYHKYHRHRLHWVGADVEFARDREIGKHDTFTRPQANPEAYFADISKCMAEWARILKEGGRAVVVVGDAIVGGEFVTVGERFLELAKSVGLAAEKRWVRNMAVSRKSFNRNARIKREHVLLFRKVQ